TVASAQEQHPGSRLARGHRSERWPHQPQARMHHGPGVGQQFTATSELQAVEGVAAISRTTAHRHQATGPQPAQMVGHQVLWLADQPHEFAHLTVTTCKLTHQPPPQRMPGQPEEGRWCKITACCLHPADATPLLANASSQIDAISLSLVLP